MNVPFTVVPDDTWGVLGPTECPLCRNLRRSPLFAGLLIVSFAVLLVAYDA